MFAWVLARVEKKLEGWKEKQISKAGERDPYQDNSPSFATIRYVSLQNFYIYLPGDRTTNI